MRPLAIEGRDFESLIRARLNLDAVHSALIIMRVVVSKPA
jgi:hypothetical protein